MPRPYQPQDRQQNGHMAKFSQFLAAVAPYIPTAQLNQQQAQFDAEQPLRDAQVKSLQSEARYKDTQSEVAPILAEARSAIANSRNNNRADTLTAAPGVLALLEQLGIPKPQIAEFFGTMDPQFAGIQETQKVKKAALVAKINSGAPLTPEEQVELNNDPGLLLSQTVKQSLSKNKK